MDGQTQRTDKNEILMLKDIRSIIIFCQISKMVTEMSGFSCSVRDTPTSKSGEDLDWIKCHEGVGMVGLNNCAVKVC